MKRLSRSTRKIYTPALCATINLTCKIASRQSKKPLSSPLILKICHAEDYMIMHDYASVCFRQQHLGQKAIVLVNWTRYNRSFLDTILSLLCRCNEADLNCVPCVIKTKPTDLDATKIRSSYRELLPDQRFDFE